MNRKLIIATAVGSLAFALQATGADFNKYVLPMLEEKCMQCHRSPYKTATGRTKKPKGGLNLSTPDGFKEGGDSGDAVVAKDVSKSLVYERVTLDKDHDDFMPPEGKADPLTDAELKALKEWIEGGADLGDWNGTAFDADGTQ